MLWVKRMFSVSAMLCVSLAAVGQKAPDRIDGTFGNTMMPVPFVSSINSKRAIDVGPTDKSLVLHGLTLHFALTANQQTSLNRLLSDQQNPASSRYHQWLTPEQFSDEYGLSSSDLQRVSNWLVDQGFIVTQVARGGLFIKFSGTVAVAEKAFQIQVRHLRLDGEDHYGVSTAPLLPSAIAQLAAGVGGLHDFHSKPARHLPASVGKTIRPAYTSGTSPNVVHTLAPADLYTIYDETPLLTKGITGAGTSIAIIGQSDLGTDVADVAAFRAAAGLPATTISQVLYGTDPGFSGIDEGESLIDLQWSGAGAPGAKLVFARGLDAFEDALVGAIDDNLAAIVSSSYSACEAENSANQAYFAIFYPLFMMADAQGQTLVTASGDQGATACDYPSMQAAQGLAANFPGSSPFVTAVGGTQFTDESAKYWSSSNTALGGSALSYIPESVWDNAVIDQGSTGGVSRYVAKPYWQVGTGVPVDFARDTPDLALNASSQDAYIVCTVTSCVNGFLDASGKFTGGYSGTSFSGPIFAGVMALVNQQVGARVGNANPVLYALANSSYAATVFHDVVTGSNATACLAGSLDCPNGGVIGYSAGVGYDLATGWGSIDIANLVNSWKLVTPLSPKVGSVLSTIQLGGPTSAIAQGVTARLLASVSPGSASDHTIPTGTVQFLVDNLPVGSAVPLVSGAAPYSLDTTGIRGLHTIEAAYSGDSHFAGGNQPLPLSITATSPAAASVTTVSGSPVSGTVGVTVVFIGKVTAAGVGSGIAPTGSMEVTLDNATPSSSLATLLNMGSLTTAVNTTYLTPGPHTLLMTYLGDTNYAESQGSFVFTVVAPSPDFTLSASTSTPTIKAGSSTSLFILANSSNFSGTVLFETSSPYASFGGNSVTLSTSSPNGSVGLTLNAFTKSALASPQHEPWFPAGTGIALAGLMIFIWPARRRRRLLVVASFSVCVLTLAACGGATSPTTTMPPTTVFLAPGSYPIAITATGTAGTTTVTHMLTVTFVVQ